MKPVAFVSWLISLVSLLTNAMVYYPVDFKKVEPTVVVGEPVSLNNNVRLDWLIGSRHFIAQSLQLHKKIIQSFFYFQLNNFSQQLVNFNSQVSVKLSHMLITVSKINSFIVLKDIRHIFSRDNYRKKSAA